METVFARSWKTMAWRGAAGVLFGFCALLWPSLTLASLVVLFGVYSLVDGTLAIAGAARHKEHEHSWVMALEGVIGFGVGIAVLLWTNAATYVLVGLIAGWAMLTGILELTAATVLRRVLSGQIFLVVAGASSIGLGLALFLWPNMGAFVLVALFGSYALFFGSAMLAFAERLRRRLRDRSDVVEPPLDGSHHPA